MEKSLYDLLEEKALDPKTKDYVVSSKNYKKNKLLNRKNQKIENNHVDMINVDSNNSIFIAFDNDFLNSIAYWKDYNIHSLYDTVNDFIFGEISHSMCSLSLDQQTFKHLYFDFCFENIIIIINNIESILYKNSINSRFMLDYLKSIINSYKKIIKLNKMFFIDKFGIKYYNDFSKKKIIFVVNDDNLKNNPSKEKMLELGYPKELCDIIEEFGELKFDNNILLYNKRSDENEYKFKSL